MTVAGRTEHPTMKGKMALRLGIGIVAVVLVLFAPAGSFDYWEARVYCAVIFVPMTFVIAYFLKNDPALLERRMRFKEKETEQKAIVKVINIIFLAAFLLPGLDYRFGWSDVPPTIVLAANAVVFLAYVFVFLVMRENSYASRIIEVEKGQKVISTGPYAIVRHPMYLGMALMLLATPAALGSYWAYTVFLPLPLFIVPRLLNEEKVLLKGLPGYREYCEKTRYRLIPRIW